MRQGTNKVLGRGLKDLTGASLRGLGALEPMMRPVERKVVAGPRTSPGEFPRVVVVSSGKGGTGKSFLTVNLACGLAQLDQSVLIVDTDFGLANAHLLLGMNPRYDVSHLITRKAPIEAVLQTGPCDIRLLSGCSGITALSHLSQDQFGTLISEVSKVEKQFDWILVDTSAGISPQVMSFLTAAQEAILVVNPEATSMLDAYAMMKTLYLRRPGAEVGFVANRVRDSIMAKETFKKVNGAVSHYLKKEMVDMGYVVMDPSVVNSVMSRRPVILEKPRSQAAMCIKKIVQKVLEYEGKEREDAGESYFARLRREVLHWQNGMRLGGN